MLRSLLGEAAGEGWDSLVPVIQVWHLCKEGQRTEKEEAEVRLGKEREAIGRESCS